MMKYLYMNGIRVPSYGIIIIVGILICNQIAQLLTKNDSQRLGMFYTLEAVSGVGAILGARMLSFKEAGYSYYGGLAGFFCFGFLFCKIAHIDGQKMAKDYLFLLPLLHCIWKIGCFMGGCCYGIPYQGIFSVCYEEGVNQMAGVLVFPVQVLEALISLAIMAVLLFMRQKNRLESPVGMYLLLYGGTRFAVEFLRYYEKQAILSEGQIYSLISISIGVLLLQKRYRRKIEHE